MFQNLFIMYFNEKFSFFSTTEKTEIKKNQEEKHFDFTCDGCNGYGSESDLKSMRIQNDVQKA